MAIEKDSKILAQDVMALNSSKVNKISGIRKTGSFFGVAGDDDAGYFWVRNTPVNNSYPFWDVAVEFAMDEICYIGTTSSPIYYRSLQDENIGKDPSTEALWWEYTPASEVPYRLPVSYVGKNCRLVQKTSGIISASDDYSKMTLWKVTSLGGYPEVLSTIYSYTLGASSDVNAYISLTPGYYKFSTKVKARGGNSTSVAEIYAIQSDNSIQKNERIRVFSPDYRSLLSWPNTLITANIAKKGQLATENYVGGLYAGD